MEEQSSLIAARIASAFDVDAPPANHQLDEWFILNPQLPTPQSRINVVTRLSFDSSIRFIPESALENHSRLQIVKIGKTVKKIGKTAFSNCRSLSKVDFHYGLETIGRLAFHGCDSLEDVRLPDTVVVVSFGAFQGCRALQHVELSSRLQVLGGSIFSECIKLVEIDLPHGLWMIENCAFYECRSLRKIQIPSTVKVIGVSAFHECRSLTFVELPKGIKKIYSSTFAGCDRLSGIVLPSSLEEIEFWAFAECSSLLGVEFGTYSYEVKIHPRAFSGCSSLINVCISSDMNNLKSSSIVARCIGKPCTSSSHGNFEPPFDHLDQLCGEDGRHHIQDRFADLPIHNLCYHASVTRVDHLKKTLEESYNDLESTDYLGMTPFHIVATSANPRVELLKCLLSKYPIELLSKEDHRGYTMMDYLLKNAGGLRLLQLILRVVFAQRPISKKVRHNGEAGPRHQVSNLDLNGQIESLSEYTDVKSRVAGVREIFERVGCHMQMDLKKKWTTVLELASWKKRLMEVRNTSSSSRKVMDRQSCRYQCGADVVIANVAEYLKADESTYLSEALLAFPFLHNTQL